MSSPDSWRGQGGQPARAWAGGQPARGWGGGQREAPQGAGYGRGYPPAYPGRGYGGYPPARYVSPPAYAPNPYAARRPAAAGVSQARAASQEDFLRQGVRQGQIAPLGSVIQNLRRITPGRQLDSGPRIHGASARLSGALDDGERPARRLFSRREHGRDPVRTQRAHRDFANCAARSNRICRGSVSRA